ncbi:MAG: LCP family protein [Treponema sp.]|nr:LCP family protein [Treponema sp.]
MRKVKFDASALLLAAIILLAAAGVFFTILTLRSDPIEEALAGDRVVNILFVIEHEEKPLGSYVMMYYPGTRRATIIDIPSEAGFILQEINRVDRIDTVYNSQKTGPFEQEVGSLLGLEINFSVIFTTGDLGKLADLLEGVEIFIPSPVEVYGEAPVLFPSGVHRLDGDKVRTYITYELSNEDSELVHFRRQRFFLGLIKRLGEQNAALKNRQTARLYHSLLKTSMNQHTRVRLFDELAKIDTDRINTRSVAGDFREVSGKMLLLPQNDGMMIKDIVRQAVYSLTLQVEGNITERRFTVEVLNGTAITGLAGKTAELLRGFGYEVISIGNADRNDYEITEIIDRSGIEDVVRAFGEVIQCKNIRDESENGGGLEIEPDSQYPEYKPDFTLILGRDFNGRNVTGI